MTEIRQTEDFRAWLSGLKDDRAKAHIVARVQRLAFGHLGDVKPVGEGVSELRVDHGPGYRVYIAQRGAVLIVLLCGGTKTRQQADIQRAKRLAQEWGA
jgi:putative addiction module killer protein